jgi:superfamily II DNA/RNA helicase
LLRARCAGPLTDRLGKTAAFALPLLQRLVDSPPRAARVLVLAPTRELAGQTAELLRELAALLLHRPRVALAFGGVSINPQLMACAAAAT